MCGIAGYLNRNSDLIKSSHTICSMLKAQRHRGPDDSGIRMFSLRSAESLEIDSREQNYVNSTFEGILGFNRLSILDLSYNGHQPMVSPDGQVLLALNGEIYNAFNYKRELESWGFSFRSTTDTEVVLALYLKYGFEEMLLRLNGMFALVIVDLNLGVLFVARDRYGIKPMYYVYNENVFAFSSELKSFGFLDNFYFKINEQQLDEYLLFRTNLKGTLFNQVEQVAPGHFLTYTHQQGIAIKGFFDVNDYQRDNHWHGDIMLYSEKLEKSLTESVQRQLMSDVKLGCQLSGGIDSSLVTWFANHKSNKGFFETVSIVFNNSDFSEEKYIDLVVNKLSIPAHKFLLDSSYFIDHLEKATWHLESPINHPNTIAIYLLSLRAKEYVTVLLSGEGADEVFGGYRRYYNINYPFLSRKFLSEIKQNLNRPWKLSAYLNHVTRAIMANSYMLPAIATKLRTDFNLDNATFARNTLYNSLTGSVFDRQVKYEIRTYLPDLLIRQDKMSMAHSIENRVPFLDNEVVADSFTIPEKYLLLKKSPEGYNTEKYLLKKIIAETFGNEFAFRNKKGLDIPLRQFFKDKRFSEYLSDNVLPAIKERQIFNETLISGWLYNIDYLTNNEIESLWIAVSFEIWALVFIDKFNEYKNI
jgi:asparagine synthase (glutamine-hydrolysing)